MNSNFWTFSRSLVDTGESPSAITRAACLTALLLLDNDGNVSVAADKDGSIGRDISDLRRK